MSQDNELCSSSEKQLNLLRDDDNTSLPHEEDIKHKAEPLTTVIQILKSMVGLGIFVLPHTTKDIGWFGFMVFYPVVALSMTFFITIIIKVANDLGFHGSR